MSPPYGQQKSGPATESPSGLGVNLKLRRIKMGLSAKALAERIGVSPSLISKIENGATNPSMDALRKIVMELNVTMADLMDVRDSQTSSGQYWPERRRVAVVRADERKVLRLPKRGLEYQLLTPDAQGAAEFVWVEMAPGEGGSEFLSHERGEESLLVLEGTLDVYVGDACHRLNKGDCITYDATLSHMYRNEGPQTAIYIYVAVPPTL
jgi:transcriptional regulator with XRE-family HTH domain